MINCQSFLMQYVFNYFFRILRAESERSDAIAAEQLVRDPHPQFGVQVAADVGQTQLCRGFLSNRAGGEGVRTLGIFQSCKSREWKFQN